MNTPTTVPEGGFPPPLLPPPPAFICIAPSVGASLLAKVLVRCDGVPALERALARWRQHFGDPTPNIYRAYRYVETPGNTHDTIKRATLLAFSIDRLREPLARVAGALIEDEHREWDFGPDRQYLIGKSRIGKWRIDQWVPPDPRNPFVGGGLI